MSSRSAYSDSNYVLSVGLDDFFEPFGGLWEPTEIDADGIAVPSDSMVRSGDLETDLDAMADRLDPAGRERRRLQWTQGLQEIMDELRPSAGAPTSAGGGGGSSTAPSLSSAEAVQRSVFGVPPPFLPPSRTPAPHPTSALAGLLRELDIDRPSDSVRPAQPARGAAGGHAGDDVVADDTNSESRGGSHTPSTSYSRSREYDP